MAQDEKNWGKPQAMAIPKEGDFELRQGNYGPVFPQRHRHVFTGLRSSPKSYRAESEIIREYGKTLEKALAVKENPDMLAPLKLHYLRWVLFDIGKDTYFMYQGIFDTDFDKYTDDAVALFTKYGVNTVFENLEGFPQDWKTNIPAFIRFVREHQRPSFLEYAEYPYASTDEIKKALRLKQAFSEALDQMQ